MNNALDQTKENVETTGIEPIANSLESMPENGIPALDQSSETTENEVETSSLDQAVTNQIETTAPSADHEALAQDVDAEVEMATEESAQSTSIEEVEANQVAEAEEIQDVPTIEASAEIESVEQATEDLIVETEEPVTFEPTVENEAVVSITNEIAPLSAVSLENEAAVEEEDEEEQEDDETLQEKLAIDYSRFSKKELFNLIEELAKEANPLNAYKLAARIKPTWDSFYESAKHAALEAFVNDGGEPDSFEFKGDEWDQKAAVYFRKFRDAHKAEQNRRKEAVMANLQTKLELVAKLRSLVNSEDSNIDIKALREIQETWRRTGPVPPEQFENLNASYQFLINKFYDNRSIFFEMLDLDRKKNLAAKEELIEKAEKLREEESIGKAVKTALQLQKEFQDVGPVPIEQKDDIWNRFRAAMDVIFEKRKAFNEALKEEAAVEFDAKTALLEKLGEVSAYKSDRYDDWNNKTKEIQAIQDEWKAIKHVPRGKTEELTKKFWSEIKRFFHNKNEFFKTLDAIRNQNLQLKNELVEKAIQLQESENWDATTLEYKLLREEWKKIGPVPYKVSDAIYKKFNGAIDHFFERKKQQFNAQREQEKQNLELKNALITKVEAKAAKGKGKMSDVEEFRQEFNAIGYVPHKDVGNVVSRFHKAIDDLILNSKDMEDQEKTRNRLKVQVNHAATSNEGYNKLQKQEQYIRRRIAQLTEEIENLKNNMGFFANTKNAQSLLADYNKKVQLAELEIKELREQLKIIN